MGTRSIFTNNNGIISESFGVKFFKTYNLEHTIHGFRSKTYI